MFILIACFGGNYQANLVEPCQSVPKGTIRYLPHRSEYDIEAISVQRLDITGYQDREHMGSD